MAGTTSLGAILGASLAPFAGRLVDKIGSRPLLAIGGIAVRAISVMSTSGALGALGPVFLAERIPPRFLLTLGYLLGVVSMMVLITAYTLAQSYLFAILQGIAGSGVNTLAPLLWRMAISSVLLRYLGPYSLSLSLGLSPWGRSRIMGWYGLGRSSLAKGSGMRSMSMDVSPTILKPGYLRGIFR